MAEEGVIVKKKCLTCGMKYPESVAACPDDGTLLVPLADDSLIGSTFAERYQILSLLGEGGMGVVYKAMHQLMDRLVAIKMLHVHLVSDPSSLKRFQQEARTASLLTHPNITVVHDFGVTPDGRPYLILDYLQGRALQDIIEQEGPLGAERIVQIFSQVCAGLAHAHSKGVIHRDIKPSNIMLMEGEDQQEVVKLLDFGIAKLLPQSGIKSQHLTATGEIFGTPLYMSPEQILGFPMDARSDIYAMGCVMYELLCGKPPFAGRSLFETMQKHISEPINPITRYQAGLVVPEKLQNLVMKAMAKEPNDRQQTVMELKQELDSVFGDSAQVANLQVAPVLQPKPWPFSSPGILAAILATFFLLTIGGTWMLSKQLGRNQQQNWEKLNESAQIAFERANYAESEKIGLQALPIAERFGENDARLAETLDRLGQIYSKEGKYSQAEQPLSRALKIRQHLLGANDPEVAQSLVHLASVYRQLNDTQKSTVSLDRALQIEETTYGVDSPEVAFVLTEKALLHEHLGRFAEAESHYQRIIAMLEATMSPKDPDFMVVIKSYAKLLRRMNKEKQAGELEARYL